MLFGLQPPQKKVLRIVILDTGFTRTVTSKIKLCKSGAKDFTGSGIHDNTGHGSHIANIIADRLQDVEYCAIIVKWFNPNLTPLERQETTLDAFKYIDTLKDIALVNYSAGGQGSSVEERDVLQALGTKGIKLVVSAGNERHNLDKDCNFFPACYNVSGMAVIGNGVSMKKRNKTSNYGNKVTQWEDGTDVLANAGIYGNVKMTGTSQAAAIVSAKYIKELSNK